MEKVVLRHLSGTKGQQVESIPLDKAADLLIGRDPASHIKFDPEHDDLVGRQHARILRDPADKYRYSIVDLNSRNGTYVNKQRVVGTTALAPGMGTTRKPASRTRATRMAPGSDRPGVPASVT